MNNFVEMGANWRSSHTIQQLAGAIRTEVRHPWTLMEVCGGQTHAILRYGLHQLLPDSVQLIHGPGCPVCVTPPEIIDHAISLAHAPNVRLCTFGDMMRVPANGGDLMSAHARGASVKAVTSPLESVELARLNPGNDWVFLAVGFETTAPATALAIKRAAELGLKNWAALCAHVSVPPGLRALAADPNNRVQAFLAAGHVCAVMGTSEYEDLAADFKLPIVVTGFEPVDLLLGILAAVKQLEAGHACVENQYTRTVRPEGNPAARAAIAATMQPCDRVWRGLGEIAGGGLAIRPEFAPFDASIRWPAPATMSSSLGQCPAGEVLAGRLKPTACPHFMRDCTPDRPLGAPMVSAEGACAAWQRFGNGGPWTERAGGTDDNR